MAKLSLVAASLLVAGSLAFIGAAPRAGARAPAALRMGLADDIKATVGANDVTVYSKSTCPFCKRTKASLADLGIAAKIIEARARASALLRARAGRRRRRAAARRPRRVSCRVCARLSRDRHRARVFSQLNEVDEGAEIQATLLEITGQRTVPNVFIKGQHLGGNDDMQAAIASGKLQEMLK